MGRDSSVGIATATGLDGPEIESRWWRDFPHLSRPALGPTQPPGHGVESSWNVMALGDAQEGKWRGKWRMEWVASTLHYLGTYPALLPLMRTPRLPLVDWADAPADLNGLVRFAERQNLVSASVPSHFKRSLLCLSRGAKRPGWVDLPSSSSDKVKERVVLQLYSFSGPLWPVPG